MSGIVLIAIYFAFAGLGISDSLLESAWPSMHLDYHVAVSYHTGNIKAASKEWKKSVGCK